MRQIYSKDNALYKQLVRIVQGKKIEGTALVWLEGIHLSQAWLDMGYDVVHAVFDESKLEQQFELQQLHQRLPLKRCFSLATALMQQLSSVEQHQGVGLVVEAPQHDAQQTITKNSVYLDRIQDPGNVGTLLRTMAAAGIQEAYLSPGCAWAWSQKVLRSAQGAHFVLRIHEQVSREEFLLRVKLPIYATALEQAEPLYALKLTEPVAWVLGNEGQGVHAELLAQATKRVFIPQQEQVESLNVAAAAAVCLFEQRRQQLWQTIP